MTDDDARPRRKWTPLQGLMNVVVVFAVSMVIASGFAPAVYYSATLNIPIRVGLIIAAFCAGVGFLGGAMKSTNGLIRMGFNALALSSGAALIGVLTTLIKQAIIQQDPYAIGVCVVLIGGGAIVAIRADRRAA